MTPSGTLSFVFHVQRPKEGRGRTGGSRKWQVWENRLLSCAIREEEAAPQVRLLKLSVCLSDATI